MKIVNAEILKKYFNFLTSVFNFRIKEIKSYDHALYAKFLSNSVGIYFIYEFRDLIPQIQFTKLETIELEPRPGLYTIKQLYKDAGFRLKSFYLDEIILFKQGKEYKSYFENTKTVGEAIKVASELIGKYAKDFVIGDMESFAKMDAWFRVKAMSS